MAGPRYGVSPWIDGVPSSRRSVHPVFRGDEDAPLVVIGGGLTGVMTAYAASAAGIRVVLLEADRLGHGGSGHASGVCAGEATGSFLALQAMSGRRVARAQFDQVRRAVLDLGAAVRRLSMKDAFEATDAVRVVPVGAAAAALRKEVDARHEAELEATWLKPAALRKLATADADGGVRLPHWAACDPYRLVLQFAKAAESRGARLFEKSPVTKVAFDRTRATVTTAKGRIRTTALVHATGAPSALVRALQRHVRHASRGLVLTEPMPGAVRKAVGPRSHIVCDTATPPHLLRWTTDHRVLVTGADIPPPRAAQMARLQVQRTGQLMYELTRLYPDISGVMPAYGWSVPLAHTVDGGLFVGPHRNFPHQLFAFGTEHDPARAFLASRILLRHLQGATVSDDEHFGFARVL